MMRNAMLLIAMTVALVGIFLTDPRFLIAGAVMTAFTLLFLQFKQPILPPQPLLPQKPHVATDPVDVLQNELEMLDSEMNNFSIDDTAGKDDGHTVAYLKLADNREKISMALVELAKQRGSK